MSQASDPTAFDLTQTHVHLSIDGSATVLPDFQWNPEALAAYGERFAADGDAGRIVCAFDQPASWDSWERHPAGEEIVVLLSGRVDLLQEVDGEVRRVPLQPGEAAVNPPGVWHTADVHVPGMALFVTPGQGTEHKPRQM